MALPFITDMRVASPSIFPVRSWDDELIAVATDGSNKVWRFAHMHAGQTGYYWTVPFAHVSPDGQYALINSNWGGTLGTASDVQGTYNGSPADQKRVDVFLIELNQKYQVSAVDDVPPSGVKMAWSRVAWAFREATMTSMEITTRIVLIALLLNDLWVRTLPGSYLIDIQFVDWNHLGCPHAFEV